MRDVLAASVGILLALLVVLLVVILVGRARADRRRRRLEELRPEFETVIARYVSGPEVTIPPLSDSREDRTLLRELAVEAIVELRGRERQRVTTLLEDNAIVADTCEELGDGRVRTRRRAAELLGEIASAQSADALMLALLDPDRGVRMTAARALAELADDRFLEPAIDVVEEGAEERPGAAVAALLAIGVRTPDSLGSALREDRDPALRRLAFSVIAELRLAQYQPELRDALRGGDDELTARAARGLGAIGDMTAVDELLALVEDSSAAWFCRVVAAGALGAIGEPRAVPALETELEHGDWSMRVRAAEALSSLGEPGIEALRRAARSEDPEIRSHALAVLGS
jgi:HEAT repeat protein